MCSWAAATAADASGLGMIGTLVNLLVAEKSGFKLPAGDNGNRLNRIADLPEAAESKQPTAKT